MKALKIFIGSWVFLLIVLCGSTTTFSSCKKTTTIYDTTYVHVHDTTVLTVHIHDTTRIHDTTIIIDTFVNLEDNLVASYNFNSGSVKDFSGRGNDIIFNNATPAPDRFGKANNAFAFNGSSSYMQVKNSASLNPASISIFAIVKVNGFYNGLCHNNAIVNKGYPDNTNGVYFLRYNDYFSDCSTAPNTSTEKFGGAFGGQGTWQSDLSIETGKWYNIVYTCDGISSKIYVDGKLVSETAGATDFSGNASDLFIGKTESPQYPYFMNGVIDEVRIYSKPLSINDIEQLNMLKN